MVIDNSANYIIWRDKEDFEPDSYQEFSPEEVQGISTACAEGFPKGIGTLRVGWYNDNDKYHHFTLAGALHIPSSLVNILGISAFSRIIGDYEDRGTRIGSSGQESIFSWHCGKFRRSFPHLDAGLPELPVDNGYSKFHLFCNFVEKIQPITKQCYAVNDVGSSLYAPYKIGEILTDRENDQVEDGVLERIDFDQTLGTPVFTIKFRDSRQVKATKEMILAKDEDDVASLSFQPSEFLRHAKCLSEDDLKLIQHPLPLSTIEREWMREHDRLGHISFAEKDKLVKGGVLAKKFAALCGQKMLCPSCMFGRMKRRPWQVKGVANRKCFCKQHAPGAKVSVDQIMVSHPGLIPRMSGRHTNDRICGAIGSIDHFSKYSYSQLQTSFNAEQTLDFKLAFKSHANTCCVTISSYRADNGWFAKKLFRDAVDEAQQSIDFYAVGADHQNGVIEQHFQTLSSQSRTILLHAKRFWPSMISPILWPFAYKYVEYLHNHLHMDDDFKTPVEKFCGSDEKIEIKHLHTWGSPCYVLDAQLQSGDMVPRLEPQS